MDWGKLLQRRRCKEGNLEIISMVLGADFIVLLFIIYKKKFDVKV